MADDIYDASANSIAKRVQNGMLFVHHQKG